MELCILERLNGETLLGELEDPTGTPDAETGKIRLHQPTKLAMQRTAQGVQIGLQPWLPFAPPDKQKVEFVDLNPHHITSVLPITVLDEADQWIEMHRQMFSKVQVVPSLNLVGLGNHRT